MAIGFTVLYAKLANVLSTENLFYACIVPFIAFFAAFAFVLYPARGVLHPTALCDQLVAAEAVCADRDPEELDLLPVLRHGW